MISNDIVAEIPLSNTTGIPREGPRAVLVTLDFSLQSVYAFDLLSLTQRRAFTHVQSLYIDNSANTQALTVLINQSLQSITVAANEQGYYPVLVPQTFSFTFTCTGSTAKVKIHLLNFPAPSGNWGPALTIPNPLPVTVTFPNPLPVSDSILDGCVAAGKLAVHIADATVPVAGVVTETTLDACVIANKIQVQDASAETSLTSLAALISAGKLSVADASAETSLASLAGTVSAAKIAVADAILDACVAAGKLSVADASAETSLASLAALISGGKLAVADASAETSLTTLAGTVSAAKIAVADAILDACVSGGKVSVADAILGACISANKLAVTDASAESSLTTLAGAVSATPNKMQIGTVGNGGSNYPKWIGNTVVNTAVTATSTTLFTAAAGFYITSIFCSFDPKSTQSVAGVIAVQFNDSVAGTFWSFYVFIPASAPTLTVPTIVQVQTPAGFFWNNKNSASTLKVLLSSALTAGGMAFTLNYGNTTIIG